VLSASPIASREVIMTQNNLVSFRYIMLASSTRHTEIRPRLLAGGGSATRRSVYTDGCRKPRRSTVRSIRVVQVGRRVDLDVPLWTVRRCDGGEHLPTRPGHWVRRRRRVFHGPRGAAGGRHDASVARLNTGGAHRRRNASGITSAVDVRRTAVVMFVAVPTSHH